MNEYILVTLLLGIIPFNLFVFVSFLIIKPDEWTFKYAFNNFIKYKPITIAVIIINIIYITLIILTLKLK